MKISDGLINVFLSRPTDLNSSEIETINKINGLLQARGIKLRTIGTTDFPNETPMIAIKKVMDQCEGAIILGFPQIRIERGIKKAGTRNEEKIDSKDIPTPWNQIEATMAFMLDLPLLIIKDGGIDGGVFDIGVTNNYIHKFNLKEQDWLNSEEFLQPFNEWHREVIKNSCIK
ncbi:hypothetical protein [Terrisporobacter vanillatitrophus]|uniref:hypothetical protein n=1 Tax=Terrisporobacter vanillatitrophus TaxID=3058402 RepID=UPI003365D4D6